MTDTMADLDFASAGAIAQAIRHRDISAVEVTARTLARIDRFEPRVNAFAYVQPDTALEQARHADAELAAGRVIGPLHGVPVHVKESFAVAGQPCTWGVTALNEVRATANSDVVDRLLEAGAVLIGGTNVPVNLADHQSFNPIHGTSNNPYDLSRTPGGSSGGCAAALAAGLGYLSVGSDIGGSIRVPSHYSGIFGHKPSVNLISVTGYQPGGARPDHGLPRVLDVAGPMARSASDLRMALEILGGPTGPDAKAWSWRLPAPRARTLRDFRVGYMFDGHGVPLSSEVRSLLEAAVAAAARSGARIQRGWPDDLDRKALEDVYFQLLGAFLYSEMPPEERGSEPPVFHVAPDLMARGASASFVDWQDTNRRRLAFRAIWERYFEAVDVFLMPVTFTPAFPHDHHPSQAERRIATPEGLQPYLGQFDWIPPATLSGCPATVAPIGMTRAGLPVGIQIMGPLWEDATPIAFAELLTQELGGFAPPPGYGLA